jgi:hypothetical protein
MIVALFSDISNVTEIARQRPKQLSPNCDHPVYTAILLLLDLPTSARLPADDIFRC